MLMLKFIPNFVNLTATSFYFFYLFIYLLQNRTRSTKVQSYANK